MNSNSSLPKTSKKCPYCAENILIEAIKCKHCKEFLHENSPTPLHENDQSNFNLSIEHCEECGFEILPDDNFCSNCQQFHLSSEDLERYASPPSYTRTYSNNKQKSSGGFKLILKIAGGVILFILALELVFDISIFSADSNTNYYNSSISNSGLKQSKLKKESCYNLGVRYGRCSLAALKGESCNPADDIVIPERCRNKKDTENGIAKGLYR